MTDRRLELYIELLEILSDNERYNVFNSWRQERNGLHYLLLKRITEEVDIYSEDDDEGSESVEDRVEWPAGLTEDLLSEAGTEDKKL